MRPLSILLAVLALALLLAFAGCENNSTHSATSDDDASTDDDVDDDADDDVDDDADDDLDDDTVVDDDTLIDDDTLVDDDTVVDDDTTPDDDTVVDDDADDDAWTPPPVDNVARANGFKLFYQERVSRLLLAWNRFGLAGDAAFGTNIHKHYIAKTGNEYEVVAGETDNNNIGYTAFSTWHDYRNLGGRDAELTLIRMFEGLQFYEAITGHSGLTSREELPGWTRVMDGVSDTVTRTRGGAPFTPPVVYPAPLETEILDTFYSGIIVTYREDPGEYYWNFKPINELEGFAITYVFSEPPYFLRESDCCSSWMITQEGPWIGAYWGNHNSRDNFPDMSLGFLAAMDVALNGGAPDDVREAAQHAADAGHRVGDRIVADQDIQMTVPEGTDYDQIIPGGQVRPDGTTEWQDLGSFDSCVECYLAKALTTEGLDLPVPVMPLPGSLEMAALRELFQIIGITPPTLPVLNCHSIDDAYFGMTWSDMMNLKVFGQPWYEVADQIAQLFPDLFPQLLGSTADDFKEMEMGAMALCYYADLTGKADLLETARATLKNLIDLHRILAKLAYSAANSPNRTGDQAEFDQMTKDLAEELYHAAFMGALYGLETPLEDFENFQPGLNQQAYLESILSLGDTAPWPLITDDQIKTRVENSLAGEDSWIVQRYRDRFGDVPPVRRAGDGYEAIGADGDWHPAENPHHQGYSASDLMWEMPLCTKAPWALSCDWARLGCARPDLDNSGAVDATDLQIFTDALAQYAGQTCDAGNSWCGGADLDHSGAADQDDADFMNAAQGCVR